MKKKQLNNRLLLNKKTISNIANDAVKGGQTGRNCGSQGGEYSVVHTCAHSDIRTCTAETYDVCLTVICG